MGWGFVGLHLASPLLADTVNVTKRSIEVVCDIVVREPDDLPPVLGGNFVLALVCVLPGFVMAVAVDLDHDLGSNAREICNVSKDRVLPTKFESAKSCRAQL